MPRGGYRAGAGRKEGSKTKKTTEIAKKAAETGQTPLEYMLDVMRSPFPAELKDAIAECVKKGGLDEELVSRLMGWHSMRFEAAKASAPYMHARLQAHEVSGKDGGPIEFTKIERVIVKK